MARDPNNQRNPSGVRSTVPRSQLSGQEPDGRRRLALPVLAGITGLVFLTRGILDLFAHVTYWRPVTPTDCAAISLYSLALVLLAGTPWLFRSRWPARKHQTRSDATNWWRRAALFVGAFAAAAAAVANFLEDFFGAGWAGPVYATAMIALTLGVLSAAIVCFIRRKGTVADGLVLLGMALGLLLIGLSFLLEPIALLALSAVTARRQPAPLTFS